MAIDPGRVKSLFQAAIERNDPVERGAFLDREAGGDAALRGRLDALLAAYDEPPGALDRPLGDDLPTIAAGPDEARDPPPSSLGQAPTEAEADGPNRDHRGGGASTPTDQVIAGRYRLRQLIGEGGMGSVYLAEQIQPVRRRVALKLIRAGDGLAPGPGPVRVRAAGAGDHGPPEHRPGARRRDDRAGPPVLRHGAGQGRPPHRVLRPAPPRHPRPAGALPPDLLGGPARPPEGDHPPRPEADQHPGRGPRRPAGPQGDRLRPGQGDQRACS